MCLLSFLKWGSIGYSLGIVQWDFTRLDHPGNPGRVSESGPVTFPCRSWHYHKLHFSAPLIHSFEVISSPYNLEITVQLLDCPHSLIFKLKREKTRLSKYNPIWGHSNNSLIISLISP